LGAGLRRRQLACAIFQSFAVRIQLAKQVFRVFRTAPNARSPSRSLENPFDFATADVAAADSYKTTALPIELGRHEFLTILASSARI